MLTDTSPTLADYFNLNLPPDEDIQHQQELHLNLVQSPQLSHTTKAVNSDLLLNENNFYVKSTVTGTPKPDQYNLDDIFISVKTTKNYHDKRLAMIIKTWFQLAKDQVSYTYLYS